MKHYKFERPTTESEATIEDRPNWLTILLVLAVGLLASVALRYGLPAGEAMAAESIWHSVADGEIPQPDRVVWIQNDGCAKMVRFGYFQKRGRNHSQMGFYTDKAEFTADRWLYVMGDPQPLIYCEG